MAAGHVTHVQRAGKGTRTAGLARRPAKRAATAKQETASGDTFAEVAARLAEERTPAERARALVAYAADLPPFEARSPANRVMGCAADTWVDVALRGDGTVDVRGDSASVLTRGAIGALAAACKGLSPEGVLAIEETDVVRLALNASAAQPAAGGALRRRDNATAYALWAAVRGRARRLADGNEGGAPPPFPSLVVSHDGTVTPNGTFAEQQARFLSPSDADAKRLADRLAKLKVGVVAHFYMDPQVQGLLIRASRFYPHIFISDSLVMAGRAVEMARAGGCRSVFVLGVDFMSENVAAMLDENGMGDVRVFRMDEAPIGCTLADAADSDAYRTYLAEPGSRRGEEPAAHVVYINTSLRAKAKSDLLVPTVTCTSSNVVRTVLQAFLQLPEGAHVYYGPDAYMGANVTELLTSLAELGDDAVAAVHEGHTAASVAACLPRFHYFEDGVCMVHEAFGSDVADVVAAEYADAYVTAHLEVPGEMFRLALRRSRTGFGAVGSTQTILNFINDKVDAAVAAIKAQTSEEDGPLTAERIRVVLGTEVGMLTSIVESVRDKLAASGPVAAGIEVEIIMPVSSESVTPAEDAGASATLGGAVVLPGPAAGEGCSLEGGCAACPYMKMNTLAAMDRTLDLLEEEQASGAGAGAATAHLTAQQPEAYAEALDGSAESVAARGCRPIVRMQSFQANGVFPDEFVAEVRR